MYHHPPPITCSYNYWFGQLEIFLANQNHLPQPQQSFQFLNAHPWDLLRHSGPTLWQCIKAFVAESQKDVSQIFALFDLVGILIANIGEPFIGAFGNDFEEIVSALYKNLPFPGRNELIATYLPIWSQYFPFEVSRTHAKCMEILNTELLQNHLTKTVEELENAKSKIQELESIHSDHQSTIDSQKQEIEILQSLVHEYESRSKDMEDNLVKAQKQIEEEKQRSYQVLIDNKSLEKENSYVENQLEILRNEYENLANANQLFTEFDNVPEPDYKGQIYSLQSKLNKKNEELAKLEKMIEEKNDFIKGIQDEVLLKDELVKEKVNVIESLNMEIQSLTEKVTFQQSKEKERYKEAQEFKKTINELFTKIQQDVKTKEEEVTLYKNKILELSVQLENSNIQSQIDQIQENQCNTSTADLKLKLWLNSLMIKNKDAKIKELENEIVSKSTKLKRIKAVAFEATEEIERVQRESEMQQAEIKFLKGHIYLTSPLSTDKSTSLKQHLKRKRKFQNLRTVSKITTNIRKVEQDMGS